MPTAVAITGAALLSSRASERAADAGSDAARASGQQIAAAAAQAREDVLNFFPGAQQDLLAGAEGAFNLLGGGIGAQQQALSQGNLAAQQTLGGGFNQIQNALLGLPVNTEGFTPQGIDFTQAPINPFAVQPGGTTDTTLPSGLTNIGQVVTQREDERILGNDIARLLSRLNRPGGTGFGSAAAPGIIGQLRDLGVDQFGNPLQV